MHRTLVTTQRHNGSELDPDDTLVLHEAAIARREINITNVYFDRTDVVDEGRFLGRGPAESTRVELQLAFAPQPIWIVPVSEWDLLAGVG